MEANIYFDNAATTRPLKQVLDYLAPQYTGLYGNPSSMHTFGFLAEKELKEARRTICRILACRTDELIFTSGGTESNNMALFGLTEAVRGKGMHVITARSEHPSVYEACIALQRRGFQVEFCHTKLNGEPDLNHLERLIREDTVLVSLMQVNHETGAMTDVEAVGRVLKSRRPDILFHVDGVQGFGKHPVSLKDMDAYSISAHKIYGLKGTGALYLKRGVAFQPLFYGGAQNDRKRPGTENTWGIVGFGVAAQWCADAQHLERVRRIKSVLVEYIQDIQNVQINGNVDLDSPYILNVSFIGVQSETLVHALAQEGVYVSAGAACHQRAAQKSLLSRLGNPDEIAQSAVRFSFSWENTEEQARQCGWILQKQVAWLRKFYR